MYKDHFQEWMMNKKEPFMAISCMLLRFKYMQRKQYQKSCKLELLLHGLSQTIQIVLDVEKWLSFCSRLIRVIGNSTSLYPKRKTLGLLTIFPALSTDFLPFKP